MQISSQRSTALVGSDSTQQQFDTLFAEYGDFVYANALALLKNPQDAEDAMQEVFIRVYRGLHHYDEAQGSMQAWLRAILLNYCRDKWRKRKLFNISFSLLTHNPDGEERDLDDALAHLGGEAAHAPAPDLALLRRESNTELWNAVNRLDEKLRRVVVLRYFMGISGNKVAELLGLPEGTVYSRLHHARVALQRWLKQSGEIR